MRVIDDSTQLRLPIEPCVRDHRRALFLTIECSAAPVDAPGFKSPRT